MKVLLKNATIVNVFTEELEKKNLLVDDDKIVGVGNYAESSADVVEDLSGKYICPGFIDGHIHIESTMLTPCQLAKVSLPHGTTAVVADPHEIANVCGVDGIKYMLGASKDLPLKVFICLPSCVPATPFDESGAVLNAADIRPLYQETRVVGLAEMMNYPGVLFGDEKVLEKIADAKAHNRVVDGHAPLLSGENLDKYVAAGVQSDHECTTFAEAKEKISKGQWIMIREGTAARNLKDLLPLFDSVCSQQCMLATDDRHPADLMTEGHIDNIVRKAVQAGKPVVKAIRMATVQAAKYFSLKNIGAIAPGYKADFLVLDDLNSIAIRDVYVDGKKVVKEGEVSSLEEPIISENLRACVEKSFHLQPVSAKDFYIQPQGEKCRVIKILPGQLLTDCWETSLNFSINNGIDVERDILKLAVVERHGKTGHKGLGFVNGLGFKKGAIASSVSHDSHNLIVVGATDEDMALAANRIIEIGGGNVVVADGEIIAEMPLPIAGLMSKKSAQEVAAENEKVRASLYELGVPQEVEPFMNMAFVSLPVIPHLKMTPNGLVDVDKFACVSLFLDD